MNYISAFNNRAKSFLSAINKYNYCMNNEFITAINSLKLKPNDILVGLGTAGLNVERFIRPSVDYIPFEFSPEFSQQTNIPLINYNNIPIKNERINKVLILALLHHFSQDERRGLYNEVNRILTPNGRFVVADVIKDSVQDYWLNTIVNKYNPEGHKGLFFDTSDADLFRECGFEVTTEIKNYTWYFNNEKVMLDYMKKLFYLNISDDELLSIIKIVLKYYKKDNKIHFNWQLMYFICSKCSKSKMNLKSIPILQ